LQAFKKASKPPQQLMPDRIPHYLDESLKAVQDLPVTAASSELVRLLINLCGAVRSLERECEELKREQRERRSILSTRDDIIWTPQDAPQDQGAA